MTTGLRAYARHEPVAFEHAMTNQREIAHRFVTEVSAAHATGAVVAAGKYGEELAKLSVAASVPILTEAFTLASGLARQYGGIAKPAGAGGGEIGVALFATPEAAELFKQACRQPLAPLAGAIEPFGVRCRNPKKTVDDSNIEIECVSTPSPEPSEIAIRPVPRNVIVVRSAHEAETVRERKLEVPPAEPIGPPRTHYLRRRLLPVAAIAVASVVTWYTFPRPTEAPGYGAPNTPSANEDTLSPLAMPVRADPSAEAPGPPKDAGKQATDNPVQAPPAQPSRPAPAHAQVTGRSAEPKRHARSNPGHKPTAGPVPDVPVHTAKPSARRAGSLSADDF
jgi:hypothetical protein